jgi:hypothetical protein
MDNQIVEKSGTLTEIDMQKRVNLMQKVMKQVMKKDVHYGIVPGCGKPSLLKAGAEILALTFQISPELSIEDLSTKDANRYRITCNGYSRGQEKVFLGAGIGECSSDEEKYQWRASICDEEWESFPISQRREKFKKEKFTGKVLKIKQVKINPPDIANTVLKMAKKRAFVDMTLTVTGASDIFTQEIEEIEEIIDIESDIKTAKPEVEMPKQKVEIAPATLVARLNKVTERVTATGKTITDYFVTDNFVDKKIMHWCKKIEGAISGVMLEFKGMQTSEYRGEIQFTAKNVTIIVDDGGTDAIF